MRRKFAHALTTEFVLEFVFITSLPASSNGEVMVPLPVNKPFLCAWDSILLIYSRVLLLQPVLSLLHCHFSSFIE